ncbi:CAP domain-containing protein [Nocardioides sp.]|uniref:CAP domain-containing protein n=1 Tax=Nocardioides sp. TaxID=35761 RepID=UPI00271BBBA1|nr:CAP domain-containing protein [Nocardioides sp.]MDO9454817.1 CAP domain-containing protein [Nocardioides sp.]
MRRSPHPRFPVLLLAPLLLALVALSSLASPSYAAQKPRAATAITGWASSPTSAVAGTDYVAHVDVTGAHRAVLLQRRVGASWRTVDTARSSRSGHARLAWDLPAKAGTVALRVRVTRTARRTAAVTPARLLTIRSTVRDTGTEPGTDPGTEPAPPPVTEPDPTTPEEEVVLEAPLDEALALINEARAAGHTCGDTVYAPAPPLTANARLGRAADDHAELMASQNFFSHTSLDGSSVGDRLTAAGYPWTTYGENIAAGRTDAASTVAALLASPGHCRNIMSASVTEVGLGYAYDASSTYGHYWVQDFAAR